MTEHQDTPRRQGNTPDEPWSPEDETAELPDAESVERARQEEGNRGPDEEPGFGQGA